MVSGTDVRATFFGLTALAFVWSFPSKCEGQSAFLDTNFNPRLNPGAQVYALALYIRVTFHSRNHADVGNLPFLSNRDQKRHEQTP